MSSVPEAVEKEAKRRKAQALMLVSSHVATDDVDTFNGIRQFGLVHPAIHDVHGRFMIREFVAQDYPRLREMNDDLFFAPLRHIYGPIRYLDKALTQQKLGKNRRGYTLAVEDAKTGELIGSVMLYDIKETPRKDNAPLRRAEIAYFVDPTYQNIKVATDAVVRMLYNLGHALRLDTVDATADPQNEPSRKLLARLGFKKVGHDAVSRYKADPGNLENYERDAKGRILKDIKLAPVVKFAPRDRFVVTFDHFVQQRNKITRSPEEVAAIDNARANREKICLERTRKVTPPRIPEYSPSRANGRSAPRAG